MSAGFSWLLLLSLAGCSVNPKPAARSFPLKSESLFAVEADAVVGYIVNGTNTIYLGNSGQQSNSSDVWMIDGIETLVSDTNYLMSLIDTNL